jgi:hypothetical protein
VATYGYAQAQAFYGQSAQHKGSPRPWIGIENQRGEGEEESRWHGQQSGVLHDRSFPFQAGRNV